MSRISRTWARFRWPRWTTRRLLVAVAITGFVLGGVDLARRRQRLQLQALKHEVLGYFATQGSHHSGPDPDRARYHESLRLKYLRAANQPWLAVERDPPSP